jgi:hypothetical protein
MGSARRTYANTHATVRFLPRRLCPISLSLSPLHHAHVHILCLTRFLPSRTPSSLWLRIGCPFLLLLAVPYVLFALDQRMMGLVAYVNVVYDLTCTVLHRIVCT